MEKEVVKRGLKIRVKRGIDLANRDVCASSSDPYVVITMGDVKVETRKVKANCNPEWDHELTLPVLVPIPISDYLRIKLSVFDHDYFSRDDEIGEAEIDIKDLEECCMNMNTGEAVPVAGTTVRVVQPSSGNCLAEESEVVWTAEGKMVQNMTLKLNNVECGKVEIQVEYVQVV